MPCNWVPCRCPSSARVSGAHQAKAVYCRSGGKRRDIRAIEMRRTVHATVFYHKLLEKMKNIHTTSYCTLLSQKPYSVSHGLISRCVLRVAAGARFSAFPYSIPTRVLTRQANRLLGRWRLVLKVGTCVTGAARARVTLYLLSYLFLSNSICPPPQPPHLPACPHPLRPPLA